MLPEEDRFATGDLILAMTVRSTVPELQDCVACGPVTTKWSCKLPPGCQTMMIEDRERVFESVECGAIGANRIKVRHWWLD